MRKDAPARFLAIALILCVCVLGAQSVGHWHDNPLDEQHCQVCHIGQAAIPQPAIQAEVQSPVPVARFVPADETSRDLDPVRTLSVPRAPPA
jgi:hypothetical protein